MADILSLIPADLHHMDDDEKELAKLPTRAARMKYHRRRLEQIDYAFGTEGVRAYVVKHPEAKAVRFRRSTRAYLVKPTGYDQFLCDLVETSFNSETARRETNRSAVSRMNEKLGSELDPNKHFSQPLSAGRLKKIAAVFAKHGVKLDIAKTKTMSAVRSAIKAAKAHSQQGKPFSVVGTINGDILAIGDETLTIARLKGRAFVRPTVAGGRSRLYLDDLEWFANLLVRAAPTFSQYSYTNSIIGEPATSAKMGSTDPLADAEISGLTTSSVVADMDSRPFAPSSASPLALRIAALRSTAPAENKLDTDDVDPLSL